MKILALDHVVLNVGDVERSLDFYVGLLGLAPERLVPYRDGAVPFPSVRITPETMVDLFPAAERGDRFGTYPNVDHLCLVVEGEIANVQAALADAGIDVDNGPTQVFGARGIGTSVYVRDPDGNSVELRCYGEGVGATR